MRKSKRLFAMLLTLIMVISMAMPAMAAENQFTVTIKNPNNTVVERTLEMYQIFAGTISTKTIDDKEVTILSDIKWGNAFGADDATNEAKAAELFSKLTDPLAADAYTEFVTKYNATVTAMIPEEKAAFNLLSPANKIAEILTINNTSEELVKAFAAAIDDYAVNKTSDIFTTSDNISYTASNVAGGYYLIKDKKDSLSGADTYTDYIVQVVGDTTMTAKSSSVKVDKDIIAEDDNAKVGTEVNDYTIGDSVDFRLTGTLPSNYGDYTEFEYTFTDTMSNGLTFTEAMKANVKVYYEKDDVETTINSANYTITLNPADGGAGTTMTIAFPNLKNIAEIDKDTTINVEYSAILNANATVGDSGNENSVKITFSNNPNDDSKGTTPSDTVFVFTLELDILKTDGTNPLSGATFVLYKKTGDPVVEEFATIADNKISGWTNEAGATPLTTPADGKILIQGLEAGTYYIRETVAPTGYNKLTEDIKVVITATEIETDNDGNKVTNESGVKAKLESLTIKVDNEDPKNGTLETGIVSMDVINNAGSALPETGGVGTTLFYLIGGAMALFAIVLLITKKRMASEN